ncbi:hypothetical protein V6N13_106779 [Hibiscus sabdariffa]
MSESQGTQSSQNSSPTKVNDPTSNKRVRKKQQPRASCWSHFTKYVTKDEDNRASCKRCDSTYSMETGGSITNLNNHLKTCFKKPRVDNASDNTVGVEYLRNKLNHWNVCVANGKYMHTRCVAHAINLIVQEGVKHAFVFVDRVRAVVKNIRASLSRIKKFYKHAKEEMIETKPHLCLDVHTRWNSTYMMLKVAAKYVCAFDSYAQDDHSFFIDLSTGDGVPMFDDWENFQRIEKVLEPFYDLTLKVSGSLHVTSHFFRSIDRNTLFA